jgi:hypothetical protein
MVRGCDSKSKGPRKEKDCDKAIAALRRCFQANADDIVQALAARTWHEVMNHHDGGDDD